MRFEHITPQPFQCLITSDDTQVSAYIIEIVDTVKLPQFHENLLHNIFRNSLRTGNPKCITIDFRDRKSTRLNSSHVKISYAVFCLKKNIEKTSHVTA